MRRAATSVMVSGLIGISAVAVVATSAVAAHGSAAAPSVADQGTVYLIQGVDDATMTLSVDGRQVAADAPAKTIVGPLRMSPGRHTVTGTPGGGGAAVNATLEVASGSSTDAVLHRQVDPTKPPAFTTYPNDLSPVTAGSGRLTVAHTAAVGPADIRVKGKVLFSNIANGEELTLVVPAGTYPVDIVPTAATSPVVLGPVDLPVARAALTRVFAIGVAATGSMDAVVQVLPVATRGSGSTVSRVEAGDGGQAQRLIAEQRAAGSSQPAVPLAGWFVLAAAGLVAVSRRARRGT
jgi:hypothetical protein